MNPSLKRILKDIEIVRKNKDELEARGIYVKIDETNFNRVSILIVPRDKRENDLISPYTHGNFMFLVEFPLDYPLNPPTITFYPQQRICRLHPNYYETGKVCLSVINTWGEDWSPSTSLLSIVTILEERFNENAICFEPSYEAANKNTKMSYNQAVEYSKYKICIIDVSKCPLYKTFEDEIFKEFRNNKDSLLSRLEHLRDMYCGKATVKTPCYAYQIKCDYDKLLNEFNAYLANNS